jgi:hypothetical protein
MEFGQRIVCLFCLAISANAAASNPYLEQAIGLYGQLFYEKCLQRLEQAAAWKDNSPDETRDVELYAGLCHGSLGHRDEAIEHFEMALRLKPSIELPMLTPPKIEAMFRAAKSRSNQLSGPTASSPPQDRPRPEDASVARENETPAQPALTEPEVGSTPKAVAPALVRSESVPLAWRGGAVPWVLAGTGVVIYGSAGYFGYQAQREASAASTATLDTQYTKSLQTARQDALIANVAYAVASAALVGAIVTYLLVSRGGS